MPGQMAMADDRVPASSVLNRMPGEKLGYLGLDALRQEIARATTQDFGG